jgi:hypothetical protein
VQLQSPQRQEEKIMTVVQKRLTSLVRKTNIVVTIIPIEWNIQHIREIKLVHKYEKFAYIHLASLSGLFCIRQLGIYPEQRK